MLYADYASNESPIVCGDCGHEIPLYKIQHIMGEEEHFSLLSWQKVYKSIDNIWLNCLSDRFTKRQLSDPNSQLSKTGMEICTEPEKVLKKPVFYFLYQTYKFTENCPKCGKSGISQNGQKQLISFVIIADLQRITLQLSILRKIVVSKVFTIVNLENKCPLINMEVNNKMDGKCKVCKADAIWYRLDENDYEFFCYNENCDYHFPASKSKNLNDIPDWFRWKTFKDKLYDNRLKISLMVVGILGLTAFISYLVYKLIPENEV